MVVVGGRVLVVTNDGDMRWLCVVAVVIAITIGGVVVVVDSES